MAFLAALSYWVSIKVQPTPPKPDGALRHDPDYYLKHFKSSTTDVNGKLRYRLEANLMKHFPDDDSTELNQPVFTQYDAGKQYLRVNGQFGEVSSNGEDIKIYKDVVVRREPWGDKGLMTLETNYLHVLPEEDIVLTQKPVVIRQAPDTVVHATGMVYEKAKQKVTLLNRVRAHYVKPKKTTQQPIDTLDNKQNTRALKQVDVLRSKANEPKNQPNKSQDKE